MRSRVRDSSPAPDIRGSKASLFVWWTDRPSNKSANPLYTQLVATVQQSAYGAIAKRLCSGLQSRLDRFDSGSRLQQLKKKPRLVGAFLFPSLDGQPLLRDFIA